MLYPYDHGCYFPRPGVLEAFVSDSLYGLYCVLTFLLIYRFLIASRTKLSSSTCFCYLFLLVLLNLFLIRFEHNTRHIHVVSLKYAPSTKEVTKIMHTESILSTNCVRVYIFFFLLLLMVVANECVFRQTSCVFIDLNPCGVYACINRFFFRCIFYLMFAVVIFN